MSIDQWHASQASASGDNEKAGKFSLFLMLDNKEILKELKVLNSSIVMTGNDW